MNLTIEQLAEILAGITKAQQAIIDGIGSENASWKDTHFIPKLTTASNVRLGTPRLIDVPSRVLLRSQTRVPMDVATITRMLHEAVSGEPVPAVAPAKPALSAPPSSAPAAAGAATTESVPAAGADDLSNFFQT